MNTEQGRSRPRWGAALALAAALLLFSAAQAVVLLGPAIAVLLLLCVRPRWRGMLLALPLFVLCFAPGGNAMLELGQGWAALLAAAFTATVVARPAWGVLSRGLAAVAAATALAAAWFAGSGAAARVDALVLHELREVAAFTLHQLAGTGAAGTPLGDAAFAEQVAHLQWVLFPGVLVLQSLAALALAWMLVRRLLSAAGARLVALGQLREFRFNDHLVWVVIGGLVLVALPAAPAVGRIGWNLVFVMGSLYALRGVAVFAFFLRRGPSLLGVVLGTVATLFLYPLILPAVLLVGLGDTWVDVRARAAAATPV